MFVLGVELLSLGTTGLGLGTPQLGPVFGYLAWRCVVGVVEPQLGTCVTLSLTRALEWLDCAPSESRNGRVER